MKIKKVLSILLLASSLFAVSNSLAMKAWQNYITFKDAKMTEDTKEEIERMPPEKQSALFAAYYKSLYNCNENICTANHDNIKVFVNNSDKSILSYYETI